MPEQDAPALYTSYAAGITKKEVIRDYAIVSLVMSFVLDTLKRSVSRTFRLYGKLSRANLSKFEMENNRIIDMVADRTEYKPTRLDMIVKVGLRSTMLIGSGAGLLLIFRTFIIYCLKKGHLPPNCDGIDLMIVSLEQMEEMTDDVIATAASIPIENARRFVERNLMLFSFAHKVFRCKRGGASAFDSTDERTEACKVFSELTGLTVAQCKKITCKDLDKTYKKASMVHHPDKKGGTKEKFTALGTSKTKLNRYCTA